MADLTQVYDALRKADAAGDTESAQKLADYIRAQSGHKNLVQLAGGKTAEVGSPEAKAAFNPTTDMSTAQRFWSGTGAGLHNMVQGAGQLFGLTDRQDVAASRQLQAPLMATPAGKTGNFVGTAAAALPAVLIPGANTYGGASLIGAGTGLLAPSTSTKETVENTLGGGVGGAGGILAGRLLGAGYQGVKNLISPFFESGQNRLASEALQRFVGSGNASNVANDLRANAATFAADNTIPGLVPTSAELTRNPGLAQLQRSLGNIPEANIGLTDRNMANRLALRDAVSGIAQTDADRLAAVNTRDAVSRPLYDAARSTTVSVDPELGALLKRPSMQEAMTRAQRLAAENGTTIDPQQLTGSSLQYLKMAVRDMIDGGPQSGMGSHEQNALKSTLSSLNQWTDRSIPQLRLADSTYRNLSAPINQMDIGAALQNKLVPALSDYGGQGMTPANFASALRNGDKLAADVTGFPGSTLENTLSPGQNTTVRQVAEQLARSNDVANLGRQAGSNTAQNLISQNLLERTLGPLGLPSGWGQTAAQTAIGKTLLAPLQWGTKFAESKVLGKLTEASLDPQVAARFLEQQRNERIGQLLWNSQKFLNPLSSAGALTLTEATQ